MISMINAQSGEWENVPDGQAMQAFNAGSHTFKRGSEIEVINPDGVAGVMPAENFAEAIGRGFTLQGSDDKKERHLQEKYGQGTLNSFRAGAEQAARTFTLGASDIAMSNIAAGSQRDLEIVEGIRERKKRIKGIPNIVGTTVGMLSPKSPIQAGVKLSAKGAAKLFPKAAKGFGKMTRREIAKEIVKGGARGVTEVAPVMGVMGAQDALSDIVLENPGYTAEALLSQEGISKILKRGAQDALFGGALGFGAGALIPAGKAALQSGPAKTMIGGMKSVKQKMPVDKIGAGMQKLEDLFSIKSTGAMKPQIKMIREMNIAGGDPSRVAKILRKEGLVSTASYDAKKVVAEKAIKDAGKNLDDVIKKMDVQAKAQGLEANFDDVWKEVVDDVIKPLKGFNIKEATQMAKRLEANYSDIVKKYAGKTIPLRELIQTRRNIRRFAWKGKSKISQDTFGSYQDDVGRKLKQIEERLADQLGDQMKLGAAYRDAKTRWQVLDWANVALQNKVESETANLFLSLTDRMAAIGGGAAGALAYGINPTSMAVSAAAGLGNRAIRTRGAGAGAWALNKLNNMEIGTKAVINASNKIKGGVGRILDTKAAKVATKQVKEGYKPVSIKIIQQLGDKKKTKTENLNEQIKMIDKYNQDPTMWVNTIEKQLEPAAESMPEVAEVMAQNLSYLMGYMGSTAPKPIIDDPLRLDSNFSVNDAQLSQWERQMQIVEKPMSVLDEIENGTITSDQVTVLKKSWPNIYEAISGELISQMGEYNPKLSPQKVQSVSVFLGVPLSPYLKKDFIMTIQNGFRPPAQEAAPLSVPSHTKTNAKGLRDIDASDRVSTDAQKALISLP